MLIRFIITNTMIKEIFTDQEKSFAFERGFDRSLPCSRQRFDAMTLGLTKNTNPEYLFL